MSIRNEGFAAGGIILAAGKSKRMGRPKALLEYGGKSFFDEAVEALELPSVNWRMAIVHPRIYDHLRAGSCLKVFINRETDRGQLYSLQLALEWLGEVAADACGALVLLVDNPGNLRERTRILLDAARERPGVALAAAHQGRRGHPLWLPRRLWSGLLAWDGPNGTRGFLQKAGEIPESVETGMPEVATDIDTPAEYERLTQTGLEPPRR